MVEGAAVRRRTHHGAFRSRFPRRAGRGACAFAVAWCAALPLHAGTDPLGGAVALSSQLIDRGQAITPATPIVQGNLAWTSGGWSLGLSGAARVHAPGSHFVEATAQAARYWTLSGDWAMQAGLLDYKYPDAQRFFCCDIASVVILISPHDSTV